MINMSKCRKNLIQQIAMMLLALALNSASAWAENVMYFEPTAGMGEQRKIATNVVPITSETTEIGSENNTTWYYVTGTVTNENRINVLGTVNLILADDCNFTASKGIHVPSGSALNIYAQSVANRGSLTANNYGNDAAIGGDGGEDESGNNATDGEDSGAITIYGGTITTYGNIGGGDGGDGTMEPGDDSNEPGYGGDGGNGNVTIYSGRIRVNGNIGGGSCGIGHDENGSEYENNNGYNGGGTVNLSWATTSDLIQANFYYGVVTLQKAFNIDSEEHGAGIIDNDDINNYGNSMKLLMFAGTYYIVTIGDMPEGVTATADLELNAGLKNAVEGQVVTIGFSGVPAGKVPVISVTYGADNYYEVFNIVDNGDGTFSFTMPSASVTVNVDLIQVSGNCGQTGTDGSDVTWSYDASSKTLTISGTGPMMYYGLTNDYLHSTSPWSHLDGELKHVVIEDGVTSVGAYAFARCSKLTSVSLPASVFQIDQAAFYTSNLVRIDIPRTEAVSLAPSAFDYCPEGLSIAVPSTLLGTYRTADNWSTYADKLVGSLSEVTGFDPDYFVTGKYEFKRTLRCGVSSTICLPFGISADQASSVGLFYRFAGIDKSGDQWTVIMQEELNQEKDGLVAYRPYLFVPYIFDGMSFGDEFDFTFSGSVSSRAEAGAVSMEEDNYYGSFWSFQGVFYNVEWDENNSNQIYGFAANSYDGGSYTVNPGDFVKAGAGASIAPFRAFLKYVFSFTYSAPMRGGTRTEESLPNSMKVRLINANGTITATGDINTETGEVTIDTWSDMNGRILPEAPVEAGMYIHNGKQVLINY
jgi:hypothetical protein